MARRARIWVSQALSQYGHRTQDENEMERRRKKTGYKEREMISKIFLSCTVVLLASCQSPQKEEPVRKHEVKIAPIKIKMDVDVKIHGGKNTKEEK